ncbi:MAG TPA: N-acetylglucosamine-6-phosphate deacetylase [Terracidiphilus sp.]|nr:N-acetylglucosamine-6-phosphate deacetylase [Terracidiphilus sp.]
MRTAVTADRLWDGKQLFNHPIVVINDGVFETVVPRTEAEIPSGAKWLNFPGATLAPAFFDVHFHGAVNHDVMEATPKALDTISAFLATRGTASYLATTVTAPMDATLRALEGLADLIERPAQPGRSRPLGIHLEGPFLSHTKRGVHPPASLLAPNINLFDRMVDAARGHVRLMTLAPELPGAAELAAHADSRGVRISMGHSNATTAEAQALRRAGAVSATHTFNAMRALDHREPGILGVALTDDDLYAEIICDGIHTRPEMVKLWWRAKGPARGLLVTDGMSATGMPDGEYTLGGFAVQVTNGRAMANGVLAGSVLTQDRALENFLRFTGATLTEGLGLLTTNPSAMTGLTSQAGSVAAGMPADMAVIDANGKLMQSIVGGEPVLA